MRAVPFCRSFVAAFIGGTASDRETVSIQSAPDMPSTGAARFLLCIGSRCNMHVAVSDHTTTPNLMRCADNEKAEPWVDPAAKESK